MQNIIDSTFGQDFIDSMSKAHRAKIAGVIAEHNDEILAVLNSVEETVLFLGLEQDGPKFVSYEIGKIINAGTQRAGGKVSDKMYHIVEAASIAACREALAQR